MAKESAAGTLEVISRAYAFDGPTLDLGAAVVDGVVHRGAAVRLPLASLNRHGVIAGATGTGKTKTLQLLAEQVSAQGVPVFVADVKGDLSGIGSPGRPDDKITARAREVGQDWQPAACPVELFALGGDGTGLPVRATIQAFGPTLLAKLLRLTEGQESTLNVIFHGADTLGLPLISLSGLRSAILQLTSDDGGAELRALGGLPHATASVILRQLVALEDQGFGAFFGEPGFDTADLLRTTEDGNGVVSCLELAALQDRPRLFSTFLMWLLTDLFHRLPEVGDADKPRLLFFLDEAHLLFEGASRTFLEKVEQTVRLIRSKGVGVFFVTQTPKDIPALCWASSAAVFSTPSAPSLPRTPGRSRQRHRRSRVRRTIWRSCSPNSRPARPSSRCSQTVVHRPRWLGLACVPPNHSPRRCRPRR